LQDAICEAYHLIWNRHSDRKRKDTKDNDAGKQMPRTNKKDKDASKKMARGGEEL